MKIIWQTAPGRCLTGSNWVDDAPAQSFIESKSNKSNKNSKCLKQYSFLIYRWNFNLWLFNTFRHTICEISGEFSDLNTFLHEKSVKYYYHIHLKTKSFMNQCSFSRCSVPQNAEPQYATAISCVIIPITSAMTSGNNKPIAWYMCFYSVRISCVCVCLVSEINIDHHIECS